MLELLLLRVAAAMYMHIYGSWCALYRVVLLATTIGTIKIDQ